MENPWLMLSDSNPFVLEIDRRQIQTYNSQQPESKKLVLESIPEPFIGNPETAKVVLLLLNPGHSSRDPEAHREPRFKEALFRNLRHQDQDFPFYPLNPALSRTPSAQWWIPRTRELMHATGLSVSVISKRLMAVEWFPYHSKTSGLPANPICDSQSYTFRLVKRLLDKGVLVVRMRSKARWEQVDERTSMHVLKNPRCGFISKRNTEGLLFERIAEALTAR
jgi:hypothetical protein